MLMADVVRQDDVLTRFGGEEFAIILPETSIDEATLCAERIRAAVEALLVPMPQGDPLHVTLSLGVADFIGSEAAEDLIANADAALYRAKQSGRNRVEQAGEDATPKTLLSSAS
jgi:diguanylate cyclase (GGDEF)-like protein